MGNARGYGVLIENAKSNSIKGCYLGVAADGVSPAPMGTGGIELYESTGVAIGGVSATARNVFGFGQEAIVNVRGSKNSIVGNYIGVSGDGKTLLQRSDFGISIYDGAAITVGPGNHIVGGDGIAFQNQLPSQNGNTVIGNRIGLLPDGQTVKGGKIGIGLVGANGITIGGSTSDKGNIIVGQSSYGVLMDSSNDCIVQRNVIGCTNTSRSGTANGSGLIIYDKSNGAKIQNNLISGNQEFGIGIQSRDGIAVGGSHLIKNNIVGADSTGALAWPNGLGGIDLGGGSSNSTVDSNLVSGNGGFGVRLIGSVSGHLLSNNLIGLDTTGKRAVPNGTHGIQIVAGPQNNIVKSNKISGNLRYGILLQSSTSTGNWICSNSIGSAALSIKNGWGGIRIDDAGSNMIGGVNAGNGNSITGNGQFGVYVTGNNTAGNGIRRNLINQNEKIGINLAGNDLTSGVTPNDDQDADTGPNELTNFPVVTLTGAGDAVKADVTLNAVPNSAYIIELFGVLKRDPSGFGGGDVFLGTFKAVTNAKGALHFVRTIGTTENFSTVCGTATRNLTSSTSEFGPYDPGPPIPRISATSSLTTSKVVLTGTLMDRATGKPLKGKSLNFYVDGVLKATVLTTSDGKAIAYLQRSAFAKGSHNVDVKCEGNADLGINVASTSFSL